VTRAPNPSPSAPPSGHPKNSRSGAVLAFDFGERRIGVAVGELQLGIAHPLETIDTPVGTERFNRIAALVDEWHPVIFVVGLPLSLAGEEHRLSALARKFARRLEARHGLEVRMVDERLSSVEARRAVADSGIRGREAEQHLDRFAAKSILESFFEEYAVA